MDKVIMTDKCRVVVTGIGLRTPHRFLTMAVKIEVWR